MPTAEPPHANRWPILLALLGGILLRAYHFFRCPSVWHDEAATIVNVLDLTYSEMFGKLRHNEAAPPLFLVAERAAVDLSGDSVWILRLLPFLSSLTALILVAAVARRLLSVHGSVVAVLLMGVSNSLLLHCCEAKAYSGDSLVAVLAAYGFIETRHWTLFARSFLFAGLAPLAIGFSYPGCFVYGGVLVALAPSFLRPHSLRDRLGYLACIASVFTSFTFLVLRPARIQRTPEMNACWGGAFADWSQPVGVPLWVVEQTLEVLRYAFQPAGQVMVLLAALGIIGWLRSANTREQALLLGVPILLALTAAMMGQYPYTCARVMAYSVPALCLLTAEGGERFTAWYPRWKWSARVWVWVLVLIPTGLTLYRVAVPWPRAACDEASELVLRDRQEDEPVYANHWEYEYYFRRLSPNLLRVDDGRAIGPSWDEWSRSMTRKSQPRIWVVFTSATPKDGFEFSLPAGYRVGQTQQFSMTRVFRLEATE